MKRLIAIALAVILLAGCKDSQEFPNKQEVSKYLSTYTACMNLCLKVAHDAHYSYFSARNKLVPACDEMCHDQAKFQLDLNVEKRLKGHLEPIQSPKPSYRLREVSSP